MEIYAEISHTMLNKISNDNFVLKFPVGVNVISKKNSRAFFLSCDESMDKELMDFLEDNNISWQENQ